MFRRAFALGVIACGIGMLGVAAASAASPVDISVLEDTQTRIVLDYELGDYGVESVLIDGGKYVQIKLGDESLMKNIGQPALPNVRRSVIIPDDAHMKVNVLESSYTEIAEIDVAPSKGFISRAIDPASVAYTFDGVYQKDAFYPGELATLDKPYILRDQRGLVVELNPFQYNPATHTLRVYDSVKLEIVVDGPGVENVLERQTRSLSRAFHEVYQRHFLNYGGRTRYTPLDEDGDLLIICHDAWLANVQPLADHKNARGLDTTVVGVSSIGNNATAIGNYIQNAYNSGDLAFVLLVGDAAQVASDYSGGTSDPAYSKVAGSDDYPDVMIGRFSAESAADVDTQVARTIAYEQMPATSQDWFWRGMGVASNQGPGDDDEYDNEHEDNIRADLLAYGYASVDQIYDPSGTAAQVTAGLNNGRGIINYTGHGSTTSWSSTGFSNTHIDALTNDNMLPFIFSVACVNGNFDGYTCFGEAWLRATHNGAPTGAIGAYMSSINQSWDPPMDAQDEFVDMYVAEAYSCLGTLMYAGSCHMMDQYGSGGVAMFDTWILFGDPSVRVVMSCTDTGIVSIDSDKYACEDEMTIRLVDCGLNLDNEVADVMHVTAMSDTQPGGVYAWLTEQGTDTGQFEGTLLINSTGVDGLRVSAGDTILITYHDLDDGSGSDAFSTATAVVDCTSPEVLGVEIINIEPRSATVRITADETIRAEAYFGPACDDLPGAASGGFGDPATVTLTGLQDDSTYFFKLYIEDEAGNYTVDDNGGQCYSFSTPDIPNFFTELFESGNDLDNISLFFTPNGSVDFYAGCAEEIIGLPVDPTGHATVSLDDDDYETINLTGGAEILLYGVAYNRFYLGSNGYITFESGETALTESLDAHFSQPRISALFDDLDPPENGSVTWAQLADRVVVTFLNIEEYNSSGGGPLNTFQYELFFNGDIRISYLDIGIGDGLVGLSEGLGVDPDYYPADLNMLGACGPRPPTASAGEATVVAQGETLIALTAVDDGLPEPASLDFVIETLPLHGDLYDGDELIDAAPYVLANGGNEVLYRSTDWHLGQDSFQFFADDGGEAPEGGASSSAIVTIDIAAPESEMQIEFPLDADPGWTCEGEWEFGAPVTGNSTHSRDPGYAYSGDFVYGFDIGGDYANNMDVYSLTTTAIDCESLILCELRFQRWLGVERAPFDQATVEVSNDGETWIELWSNPETTTGDMAWTEMTFDISGTADGQSTVFVRWTMGPTDDGTTYPGWSIDDVSIWGVDTGVDCVGDLDGDGDVDLSDLAQLLAHYGETGASYEDGDLDGDGDVDLSDLAAMLSVYGGGC